MNLSRRTFALTGAGALAAWATPPSDQITLGVIGSGGRGTFVMGVFQKDPALKVGAICDVYEPNLENAVSVASKVPGTHPKVYRNYKELLADKEVHAVLIATPEHWHAQMLLDALAAGKDVYVEKPLCQTPEQGIALIEAERNSKQIIQVGMQRRSYDLYHEGRAVVASGKLGNVRMVRSWWLNNYVNNPAATKLAGPLDWEQWQGPAARRPIDPDRFRNWASTRITPAASSPIRAPTSSMASTCSWVLATPPPSPPPPTAPTKPASINPKASSSSPNTPRISSASSPSTTRPCNTRAATISSTSSMAI